MANLTYLQFNSHGFWISPPFIEVLSDFICETFESIGVNSLSQNLQNIYSDCDFNRKGESLGIVNILFDYSITNDNDKQLLVNILNQTKILILSKGVELIVEMLNDFEDRKTDNYFKSPWVFPIKTQSLIATINNVIQLLNGTWTSDNYEVIYKGYPNPMNMPEI